MKHLLFIALVFLVGCNCGVIAPEVTFSTNAVENPDTLKYYNQIFENNDPNTWALAVHGTPVEVVNCEFILNGGHGLRITSTDYCIVRNCRFEIADSLNKYSMCIGTDAPNLELGVSNAQITHNVFTCKSKAITDKHVLFVGHCNDPYVAYNKTTNGGYGIGIKGCDNAIVEYNESYWATKQGIVEKSGLNCIFRYNISQVRVGTPYRVCDDAYYRQSYGSTWYENEGYSYDGERQVFELSSPYDPVSQGFVAYDNRYFTIRNPMISHSTLEYGYMHLGEFVDIYEQEIGSTIRRCPPIGNKKSKYNFSE